MTSPSSRSSFKSVACRLHPIDVDHQEHYIKTNPAVLSQYDGPEKDMKHLELLSKAADSISDGDLVDRMIHG